MRDYCCHWVMNSQNKIYSLLLFSMLFLLCHCDDQVTTFSTATEIERVMREESLPSVAACVIKNDSIVWYGVYGNADRDGAVAATSETIYHIGSISKLFIVTAVMQLEEQGMIDISRDINAYLPIPIRNPNYPDTPITAEMLLTHTSSLSATRTDADAPGIWAMFPEDQAPPLSEWIPQFLLPSGLYHSPRIWQTDKPGQFELYSNVGSCVLAYMVEYLSGQDFREYCQDHIFDPLGMQSTSYYFRDLNQNNIAVLYQHNNSAHPAFDIRLHASGTAKSTLNDLARFLMAYMNGGKLDGTRILAEPTVDEILTVHSRISGRCLIWDASLGDWFVHFGGLSAGATAMAEIHPKSKTAVIIFCNKFPSKLEYGEEIHSLVRQKANEYIQ